MPFSQNFWFYEMIYRQREKCIHELTAVRDSHSKLYLNLGSKIPILGASANLWLEISFFKPMQSASWKSHISFPVHAEIDMLQKKDLGRECRMYCQSCCRRSFCIRSRKVVSFCSFCAEYWCRKNVSSFWAKYFGAHWPTRTRASAMCLISKHLLSKGGSTSASIFLLVIEHSATSNSSLIHLQWKRKRER